MLHFYISIIHPVLEYAVAVWHTGLTADLSDQLEAIQKRALRIIFGGSSFTNQSYEYFTYTLDISPNRQKDRTNKFKQYNLTKININYALREQYICAP